MGPDPDAEPVMRPNSAPPPLVAGSPVARALWRTYAGYAQSEVLLADHSSRVAAAASLAVHLHARSPFDVRIVSERSKTVTALADAVLDLVGPGVLDESGACLSRRFKAGTGLWVGAVEGKQPNLVNVVVDSFESPTVTRIAHERVRAVFVVPSTVAFASPATHASVDIPLDITVAGAP